MQKKFLNPEPLTNENSIRGTKPSRIGFVLGAAFLGALTGCVGYVDGPRHSRVYAEPTPVYVQRPVVVQESYVYYPHHQVYYSGSTRQYVYLEGRSWVTRPAPPRVSLNVLFASPSVNVGFHDAPAAHHATVVKTYPKSWTPPGWSHGNKGGNKEHHDNGNKKGKGKK
jgi:hypothetical protein